MKHHTHSIDTEVQDAAGIVSLFILILKAANTTITDTLCYQGVRVTRERSGFGPEKCFSSVPDQSKKPNRSILAALVPGPDINTQFFGWVFHTAESSFSRTQNFGSNYVFEL